MANVAVPGKVTRRPLTNRIPSASASEVSLTEDNSGSTQNLVRNKTVEALTPLFLSFSSTTTAHGFLKIANTPSVSGQVIWFLVVLLTIGGVVFHCTNIIIRHLQFEVSTEIQNDAAPFIYPDMTICFVYPYSNLAFDQNQKIASLNDTSMQEFFNVSNMYFASAFNKSAISETNNNPPIMHYARKAFGQYARQAKYFSGMDDYLISCTKGSEKCGSHNTVEIFERDHGLCMSYKSRDSAAKKGMEQGIVFTTLMESFLISQKGIQNFRNGGDLLEKNKMMIYFHPQGSYPDKYNTVITASSGSKLAIKLRINHYMQIPMATGCLDSPDDLRILPHFDALTENKPNFQNVQAYTYWRPTCVSMHRQRTMWTTCGCLSEELPLPEDLIINNFKSTMPYCHEIPKRVFNYHKNASSIVGDLDSEMATSSFRINCHENVLAMHENFLSSKIKSQCPTQCNVDKYTWETIASKWPPAMQGDYLSYLYQIIWAKAVEYASKYKTPINSTYWYKYLENYGDMDLKEVLFYLTGDFSRVLVYTDQAKGLLFTESEAFPIENMWSSTGGVMGLWTGISVISVIEFCELLLLFFFCIGHRIFLLFK